MQLFQVPHTGNLLSRFGITKNKISETKIIRNNTAQIHIHFLGILINKTGTIFGSIRRIFRFGRLDNKGHERIFFSYGSTKFNTCQPILLSTLYTGKPYIGNHPKYIVFILFVQSNSFLIRTCQYYFRTSTHTQGALMSIQGLSRKLLALLQNELIQVGQHRRVKTDAVFHQQNKLYSYFCHIVLQIHLVFYQLNDRYQQIGIAQPAEHIVKCAQIFIGNTCCNTMTERSKNDNRNVLIQTLDMTPDIKTIIISRTRHANNKVKCHICEQGQGLFFCRNLRKAGRITKRQGSIFVKNFFINTPVIFKHKSVIRIGYQQDIENTPRHQIGKLRIFEIKLI